MFSWNYVRMAKGYRRRQVLNPDLFGQERCLQRTSNISCIRRLAFSSLLTMLPPLLRLERDTSESWAFVESLRPKGSSSLIGTDTVLPTGNCCEIRSMVDCDSVIVLFIYAKNFWGIMAFASARCCLLYYLPIKDNSRTPASDAVTQ